MYSGFNLEINDLSKFTPYVSIGEGIYKKNKDLIKSKINNYLVNGVLDGSMIQEHWFPEIKADVFITHSHKDEEIAKGLAGWLSKNLNITAFIDSCVWGNSNDLLRDIDETYSIMDSDPNMFDYNKRNYSTSHVHMMLQTALYKMIDNVESVFVLNTGNSFKTIDTIENTIKNKTSSPWIYSEIIATTIIRKKMLSEYRGQFLTEHRASYEINNALNIDYDIDFSHLIKVDAKKLDHWHGKYSDQASSINKDVDNSGKKALDYLYELVENK